MNKYIDLQTAVIEWYQANCAAAKPTCYVPTKADLALLIAGKKIAALKEEGEAGGEAGGDDEEENITHGDINDASIHIASLQSKLEKAKEEKEMMKEQYEADIKELERKLVDSKGGKNNDGESEADEES